MKTYETPIKQIDDIATFFQDPANMPQVQMASDKTQYGWQHMSNYFRSEPVLRDGPIFELAEQEDPAIGKLPVTYADGTTKTVDDYFAGSTMDAIVVVRAGTVVFERYKTMRSFDKHIWFSCSKTIVSTMLAMLEAEGKVDVSKYVTEYVPELAGSAWDTVTVEETLDMATGLDSTEHEVPDARTNPAQGWYQWAVSIGVFPDPRNLDESPFAVLKRMKRVKPGHTAFEYNSINPFVLQIVVENVTGMLLTEMFSERVWRKIGAQGDGYYALNRQGHANGWGMHNSTLRDLARYGMAFTPSASKMSKDPIIPEAVLKKIHSGLRPEMYDKGTVGRDFAANLPIRDLANRYQWDVVTPDGDQFKSGVGGQGVYVSAPHDAVVAFFSTGTQNDEYLGAWTARTITQTFSKV